MSKEMKFKPEDFCFCGKEFHKKLCLCHRPDEMARAANAKLQEWLKGAPVVKGCIRAGLWSQNEPIVKHEYHKAKLVQIEEL